MDARAASGSLQLLIAGSTEVTNSTLDAVHVGWIGTGRMGFQLAKRLAIAGYDVAVCNRTRAKAEPLTQYGATVVNKPDDLADRDVVFTSVPADGDLLAVTVEEGGVLAAPATTPKVLVDCSTVSTGISAQVRESAERRGCDFLAAPVSGNPKVAAAGGLTLAVSGPSDAFRRTEPLLHALGRGVTYVGEDEIARLVKLCHNVFLGVVMQSLVEVTLLAQKGGTTRAAFLDFLNNSVVGSAFTRYKTPALVSLDFSPTFTMALMRKDFDIALDAARELEVPMQTAAQVASLVSAAIGAGHRDEDFAALLVEQARGAGMVLEPEDVRVDDGQSAAESSA